MKLILSESQIKYIKENFDDFNIAPYPTPEEYFKNDPEGYRRSEKLGTLNLYYPNTDIVHFTKKRGRPANPKIQQPIISPEEPKKRGRIPMSNQEILQKILQKYKTPDEFKKHRPDIYYKFLKLGLLDNIFNKLPDTKHHYKKWTPESLEQEAKKYSSRSDFAKGNNSAYSIARKIPGFLEKIFPFKLSKNSLDKLTIDAGEITINSWVSTKTEDFKVLAIKKDKIIGKSFCNPDKTIEIPVEDIVDINNSGYDKFNDLKMDFSSYYKEAGIEEAFVKGRERYTGGSNVILFLDDSRNPFTSKEDWIKKFTQIGLEDIHVIRVHNYQDFINHIQNYGLPKQVIFDHDLAKKDDDKSNTGCKAAAWLVKYCFTNKRNLPKWSIISANKYGRCCIGNVMRKFEDLMNQKSEVEPQE